MNPWPIVTANLKRRPVYAIAVVVLIGLAVALGVAISAQERALRKGGAAAADSFDLVIGAPGSETQLVLTTVFLQPAALPLIPGDLLKALAADPRVAAAAPVAFGDFHRGMPVIGTTVDMVRRFGALTIADGRIFAARDEVVVGADAMVGIGYSFHPSHGAVAEAEHVHDGDTYTVVGRLARTGSPWDRALLVPIESVWETHALPGGHESHADDTGHVGPPWSATPLAGVPSIVVKPRSVADAYSLRNQYRRGGTMAVFPGEVLVSLYAVMGDARGVLSLIAIGTQALVVAAILLAVLLTVAQRSRQIAVLRALGASRTYIFLAIWLETAMLIFAGAMLGLLVGWAGASLIATMFHARTGVELSVMLTANELYLALALIAVGGLLALLPAWIAYRLPVAAALRG